jgi:integrase
VRQLSESLAPATVEVVFRHTASVFKCAVADGLIARSPCEHVKLPRRERRLVVPLETETVLTLAETATPRYRAAFIVAAGTGLRQAELFGLTLAHVDFPRQRLHVEQQLLTLKGGTSFGPPKSTASRRTIPLPEVVLHELVAHVGDYPDPDVRRRLVFTSRDGAPVRRNIASDIWHRASDRAGRERGRREGWHALRHYYASLLIRHGESVKVVQARLGHASASETLDTYAHLWPDSDDLTREAIDQALGARVAPALAVSPRSGGR